ncbi:pentatricopeptide repeat domain-containing protein 3, mitochondrial-like isoform X2 [Mytilus californianus]|uniref:pentatricopeptide repeat domain-containing protein 3, mitochondrial-like isoform X2 n=1 Tax=Mytilus californianus TaxID=6549 RepID=UPI002245E2D1|nr:pentatricopeptide repeat domain-containing protein 3, mitochondrial-like isoform X2 [Mytilus californianus]
MAACIGKISFAHLIKIQSINICNRSPLLHCQRCVQTAGVTDVTQVKNRKPIIFPKKKKRDELTVLKCLAATVQRDSTAPDYMFIDDPHLYPVIANEKKIYTLAKSSGRKAARYFVDRLPGIFSTNMFKEEASVPGIPELMPKKIKYEHFDPSETALIERIDMRNVRDAIDMYNEIQDQGIVNVRDAIDMYNEIQDQGIVNVRDAIDMYNEIQDQGIVNVRDAIDMYNEIQDQGIVNVRDAIDMYNEIQDQELELSQETKISLLNLLAYYNSIDPPEEKTPEDMRYLFEKRSFNKTWKDNGPAVKVFNDLNEKTSEAYCAMIRGMTKYLEVEKAFELYEEMKGKGLQAEVDVRTYNGLIDVMRQYPADQEEQWTIIMGLLQSMKESGVQPNVQTFMSVLHFLKGVMTRFREQKVYFVLNEMKAINIEPTLGIYANLLQLIYNDHSRNPEHPFLPQLMDYIQGKDFDLTSKDDIHFFVAAMKVCDIYLHDKDLAFKVDALLHSKDNYKFMIDFFAESTYCNIFLTLICQFEHIDKVMEVYHRLTPNVWSPTFSVYYDILGAIDLYDAYHYLPALWSDFIVFRIITGPKHAQLMIPFFQLVSKKKHPEELQQKFVDTILWVINRWEENIQLNGSFVLTSGVLVGELIKVSLNANEVDLAWKILMMYTKHKRRFTEQISEEAVTMLLDEFIKEKDLDKTTMCLKLMSTESFPSLTKYKKQLRELDMTDLEKVVTS